MDELIEKYKKQKKEDIEEINYKSYQSYNKNGCLYIFENIYTYNNEYYIKDKGRFRKIKPKYLNTIKYIILNDINNNKIKILI